MELQFIAGYVFAVIIGVILGLVGGGGSILAVPVLVYLMGINPVTSTAYSLFIVGATALFGALQHFKTGLIHLRTAIVFAIPAFIAVYLTRRFVVPMIPDIIFSTSFVTFTKDMFIMILFGVIMLISGVSMIWDKTPTESKESIQYNYPLILAEGTVIGLITGLVGAGGGFLIIPALVLIAKLPIKNAVATSLLIVAAKSLIGFIGDVQNLAIDWPFLFRFTGLSILGIFIGVFLSRYIKGSTLKKAFGYFVLAMAVYIITLEFL